MLGRIHWISQYTANQYAIFKPDIIDDMVTGWEFQTLNIANLCSYAHAGKAGQQIKTAIEVSGVDFSLFPAMLLKPIRINIYKIFVSHAGKRELSHVSEPSCGHLHL